MIEVPGEPAAIVRQRLRSYVDQGVFQGLTEAAVRGGKTLFKFRWLLDSEFSLTVEQRKPVIIVKDLLPAIAHRSFMDSDLRKFISGRTSLKLPEHRRLDAGRVTLRYTLRKQQASLVMQVHGDQYGYAIRALLGTLNDLFAYLHLYHIEYLQRNFGVPEE